ncbi:MAG: hypothetical protein P8X64_11760 [Anaerolineales bacterium]
MAVAILLLDALPEFDFELFWILGFDNVQPDSWKLSLKPLFDITFKRVAIRRSGQRHDLCW